jgi:hypothetical protein
MNYTKPEVRVLGEAVCVIEQVTPHSKPGGSFDGVGAPMLINNAYDLDE